MIEDASLACLMLGKDITWVLQRLQTSDLSCPNWSGRLEGKISIVAGSQSFAWSWGCGPPAVSRGSAEGQVYVARQVRERVTQVFSGYRGRRRRGGVLTQFFRVYVL